MNWEAGTVHSSRGLGKMSPRPQPPDPGHGSWEWALDHVLLFKVGMSTEAGTGREPGERGTGRARSD